MAITFIPASGVQGSLIIDNTALCADEWRFDERANVIPTPSYCGGGYQEYAVGKKSLVASFSGTWDLAGGKNPFLLGFKVGKYVAATFRITNITFARVDYAIVSEWEIVDQADGVCSYTCSLIGDWQFNDFANTAA